jgi:hypothetical protein
MKIDKYYLTVCRKCYRLHGFVEERYNGNVQVLCFCDLSEKTGRNNSPTIISGYLYSEGIKTIKLYWKPISDHKDENGKYWHTPHFACGAWGNGSPDDLPLLLAWVKEKNDLQEPKQII